MNAENESDPEFLKAVERLYYWQYGDPSSFYSMLYTLFQKADIDNKRKLALCFPYELMAYLNWCNSPTQDEFFKKYGFNRERD